MSNSQKKLEMQKASVQSLYQINISAFDLKDKQKITNLKYGFVNHELENIPDEGNILVDAKTKRQLAIQDGTGHVLINKNEFANLDFDSKVALKLHESVLYLVLRFNPELIANQGTALIRKFVGDYFKYTYLSGIEGKSLIAAEDVRESWIALGLKAPEADYVAIGRLSDLNEAVAGKCTLVNEKISNQNGSVIETMNYFFSKDGKQVSDKYAMDIDFFMRIQIYLAKEGICVFKPGVCEIKEMFFDENPEANGYYIFRNNQKFLDKSNDFTYMNSVLLKKYQQARICL